MSRRRAPLSSLATGHHLLVKFIPSYFVLFDATVNGIVLLTSSDHLLLAYRNASDSCVLILDPSTVLKSRIRRNSFLGGVFRAFFI